MGKLEATIDPGLAAVLATLGEDDELSVLVYPRQFTDAALTAFLEEKRQAGLLAFNPLWLAGCVAVKTNKGMILALAARDDVTRIQANPTFTVQ